MGRAKYRMVELYAEYAHTYLVAGINWYTSYILSQVADPEKGARVLEFLDLFALTGYNSSLGKFSNNIFGKIIIVLFGWMTQGIILNHIII